MRKIYLDLENGVKKLNSDYEDIYFLLHVLYNAKTELYDRTLTDMRSRYDPTEAFISVHNKKWSDWYAINLYKKCRKCIELATLKPFNNEKWINYKWRYKFSAQGWINLYQQLLQDNRYEDWIMKETCIIKDEELVIEYRRSDGGINEYTNNRGFRL